MQQQLNDTDKKLAELIECSKAVINATLGTGTEEIGRQLNRRQAIIDELKASGGFSEPRSEQRKSVIKEILTLDKEVCSCLKNRLQKTGFEAAGFKKKASGMKKYYNGNYNLASGQLLDRAK